MHCDKTEENSVQIFIPYESFLRKRTVGGVNLLPEILDQPASVGAKSPILNGYSLVARQP